MHLFALSVHPCILLSITTPT